MSENKIEYLDIRSPDKEAWAECWVVEDTAQASAQCYIFGPKRGEEIFGLVQDTLQQTANKNNLPLRHLYTASNKGALSLIQRSETYSSIGKDKIGNDIFERVYTPQTSGKAI